MLHQVLWEGKWPPCRLSEEFTAPVLLSAVEGHAKTDRLSAIIE
jgi:hypothetical protein